MYEFGDHGGLLVLVDDEEPTDFVMYSWNDGKDWARYKFSETKIRVRDLTVEPMSTSLKFLLMGVEDRFSSVSITDGARGLQPSLMSMDRGISEVVIQLDFSNVKSRKCSDADFEDWTLGGQECILGQKTTYRRRKADADCYVGRDYSSAPQKPVTCECTEADYECDFGFYRDGSGNCVLSGVDPKEPPTCQKGQNYNGSNGYRKNPMSACTGGKKLEGTTLRPCSGKTPPTLPSEGISTGVRKTPFPSSVRADSVIHFEQSPNLLLKDAEDQILFSNDSGISWRSVDLNGRKISKVVQVCNL